MEEEPGEIVVNMGILVLCTYLARYTDVDVEVILLGVTHLASAPPIDEAQRIAKLLKLPARLEEDPEGLHIIWNDDHELAKIGDMTFVRMDPSPFDPPGIEQIPS